MSSSYFNYNRMAKVCDTLLKQSQELKTVSYHKLYDILKQHQNEVNEIRAERLARTANPLHMLLTTTSLPSSKNHLLKTRHNPPPDSQQSTRNRGKTILNAEQTDWKDDTNDESDDQELEARYMYMAQIQEVTLDVVANSRPIFDVEPLHKLNNLYDLFVPQREKSPEQHYFPRTSKMSHTSSNNEFSKESFRKQTTLLEKRMDESIPWDQKCKSSKELFKIKKSVDTIFDGVERCKQTIAKRTYFGNIDPFIQNTIEGNFCPQIRRINADLEKFHLCLNEEMVADLRYFNSLEHEVDTLKSQLETQKTQFLNEIDRLSREYYYADHMNAILGVYTDLDEVTNFQCDYLETVENCKEKIKNDKSFKENQSNVFLKEHEQYFGIQDLKAQLQDKGIAISELKKLIEEMKGKFVETKFEKSSVIRQLDAFKSQRQSILGKPSIFSHSLAKTDFSKSKSVTTQNVSHDFSKPVTAHILPQNVLPIVKNTNVITPGMYKVHTKPNQTRTPRLPQDIRKTNKRVSFSTGVIPTTSVSRPKLKSNQLEDRVTSNNSQGKKQEVEDHRRNFKFSNNKTSVTACNDSLNAKTSNVNFVYVTCGKCVLNDNNDLCVLHYINGVNSRTRQPMAVPISTREPKHNVNQSVATSSKKTVATDSTVKKSRHITRKLYEQVSKTCSWWYPKYTPSGYKLKPKSQKGNLVEIILFIGRLSGCSKHMTDLCGPMRVESFNGKKYVLVIVDYYSRDGENLDKMKEKGDACIFVGYSTQSKAYRVFNKRTRMIVETIHVNFDELPQMASDHVSSDPGPQCSTTVLEQDSLSPGPQSQENVPQIAETVTTSNELELLYSPMFSELLNGTSPVVLKSSAVHTADIMIKHGFVDPYHPDKVLRLKKSIIWSQNKQRGGYDVNSPTSGSTDSQKIMAFTLIKYLCIVTQRALASRAILVQPFRTSTSMSALSEDRFKYLVRQLGMRCLTPDELEVLAIESA
ncbi:hypothetical protein Tco_0117938 [Tanacetum coccineum]